MNNFKHNFSELAVLAGNPIIFKNTQDKFELKVPTLKETLFNQDLNTLLSILDMEVEELTKIFSALKVESHFSFILTVLTLGKKREELKSLSESLLEGLKIFLPEILFDGLQLKIKDILVTRDLFEQIVEVIYKVLKKDRIIILDTDDEFTRIEKEQKIRALKIRQKRKETKKGSFEDTLASLLYEFPQYTLKDLFNLNILTFNFLLGYVGKIANYEVSKIAAGNGLTKKHKYFIEYK